MQLFHLSLFLSIVVSGRCFTFPTFRLPGNNAKITTVNDPQVPATSHLNHISLVNNVHMGGQHSEKNNFDAPHGKPTPAPKPYKHLFKNVIDLTFVEKMIKKFLSLIIIDPDMLKIVSKGLSITFWVFASLSFLGTWGFDTKPFLNALSISGLTIGFAAKDVLTNTFAGLFLLFSKPFVRGSVISTCGYTGTVLSIDLRYVKLFDSSSNQEVLIPLNMVYSGPITVQKYESE